VSTPDLLSVEMGSPTQGLTIRSLKRSDRSLTLLGITVAGLLGLGLTFRLIHFGATRSLWIDEARLAINIASRSYRGLLLPLDYDQTAPPLFLWLTKLATAVLGVDEQALRLLPLVAGLATVLLAYPMARRLVRPATAVFVLTGAALSPVLIYYSNEVKPYAVDALLTMGLVWLTLDWGEKKGDLRASLSLLAAGAVAVWTSTPSPFVLAAAFLAVLLCPRVGRETRVRFALLAGAVWLTSFSIAYLAVYRAAAGNPYLQNFWAYSFLDPGRPELAARAWQGARDLMYGLFLGGSVEPPMTRFESVTASAVTTVLLGLACVGAYRLKVVAGAWRLALLVAPIAMAIGAAVFRHYPIGMRVMMFAAPLILILVAAGFEQVFVTAGPRRRGVLWSGVAALIFAIPLGRDLASAAFPLRWGNHRKAIREFEREAADGEPVYVSAGSLPAWIFYTTDWRDPDTLLLRHLARLASHPGPAFENGPSRDTVTAAEAEGLTYESNGRTVVLGLYTGMQVRAARELAQRRPDPGWGEVEVARVRDHASPHIWLILSHLYGVQIGLYRRLYLGGGRLRHRSTDTEALVAKYWFPEPRALE